ncbi:MAG: radical SAM protein, partial [Nitrospirota bacterium]
MVTDRDSWPSAKQCFDIVFLHPPSSFIKLKYPLSGIFGALVGSTDILGHEPVGMISMAHNLRRKGYKTKIFNVGKMLLDLRNRGVTDYGSIENFIKDLRSGIYAIGLHWAAHSPGAVELARMVKKYHPDSLVLFGGLTSTYYHEEILKKFEFVDLVVLGEVDGIIEEIVDKLLNRHKYRNIPNISYRENSDVASTKIGRPRKDSLVYIRGSGDELIEPNRDFSKLDCGYMANCMIPLVHGCGRNCPFCGGSKYFYRKYFHRSNAGVMQVEQVVENIRQSVHQGVLSFSLFGDIRLYGDEYWKRLTERLSREGMYFDVYLELFSPATKEYLEAWRKVTSGEVSIAFSPESADENVRKAIGKHYTNEQIDQQVSWAMDLGINLSLSFLFALPEQDFASVKRTQDFINELCHKNNRLLTYMFEPFLFVDPGCPIFDYPEKYGYIIEDRTLEGLIKALTRPHWYYALNYSTRWLSKKEIIEAIFFVGSSRNELYMEFLGPSHNNLLHRKIILQQKELINTLMSSPDLEDEEVEGLIERLIDQEIRQMNFSITGPDMDFAQQKISVCSIGEIFRNTLKTINRCYREAGGQKDVLTVLQELDFFCSVDIPEDSYREELILMRNTGKEPDEISYKIPEQVYAKFRELVSSLELSLEEGLIEEFVRYDWSLFLVNLWNNVYLEDLSKGGIYLPKDVNKSDVLLPLRNAYVKLNYKPNGRIIHKNGRLAL